MGTLGILVNAHIRSGTLRSIANATTFYADAAFEPLLQDLGEGGAPGPRFHAHIDALLAETPLGRKIEGIRIWRRDGALVYSTNADFDESRLPSPQIDAAFEGRALAQMNSSTVPQRADTPMVRIYFPLRQPGSGEITAIGELYGNASELAERLRHAAWTTWSILAVASVALMSLLSLAAAWTNGRLRTRRAELRKRLLDTGELARQNAELRQVAEQARLDAIDTNENLLNKIGSDLHDGPIQMLSLLVMRLSSLNAGEGKAGTVEITRDVIRELRDMAHGLVLPELDSLDVEESLLLAVARHENLTGTKVRTRLKDLPPHLPRALKTCLYRIVQECLNNAFRHAGGVGQAVTTIAYPDHIEVTVSDSGPGMHDDAPDAARGLGMPGLCKRLQTLGGSMEVVSSAGKGTAVTAKLPI